MARFRRRRPKGLIARGVPMRVIVPSHRNPSIQSVYQGHRCCRQTSPISGTLFESTKLPLTTWFLALYLFTETKNCLSALALPALSR